MKVYPILQGDSTGIYIYIYIFVSTQELYIISGQVEQRLDEVRLIASNGNGVADDILYLRAVLHFL